MRWTFRSILTGLTVFVVMVAVFVVAVLRQQKSLPERIKAELFLREENREEYQEKLKSWFKNIKEKSEDTPREINGTLDFSDIEFGAAISAFQTEDGNVSSDWFEFLSKEKPERAADFLAMSRHWSLYKEDCRLASELNLDVFRTSFEWARIEPRDGLFDQKAIEHYKKEILCHNLAGRKVMITLHHFSLPLWLSAKGGLENPRFPEYFEHYARFVAQNFPNNQLWITFNEPGVILHHSYYKGLYPPNKYLSEIGGVGRVRIVTLNLLEAHKRAYRVIKKTCGGQAMVGITSALSHYSYEGNNKKAFWAEFSQVTQRVFDDFLAYGEYQDFVGINYYKETEFVESFATRNVYPQFWIAPKGIYRVLLQFKNNKKPVFITEIGFNSDPNDLQDEKRSRYLLSTLYWIHKAKQEGVPVKMVIYWSMIDAFEWDFYDFSAMGLAAVNFESPRRERTVRPLGKLFAEIGKNKKITPEFWRRHVKIRED